MLFKHITDFLLIKRSGLFDEAYYYENYPDVRHADMDALWHFVKYGWKEGRNPSEVFNVNFFLLKHKDVLKSGINPLVQKIKFGIGKNDDKAEQFMGNNDQKSSLSNSLLPQEQKTSRPTEEILRNNYQFSQSELDLYRLLIQFDFFDPNWYIAQNPDILESGEDPWVHFIQKGMNEYRSPNTFFKPNWYLNFYRDIDPKIHNPLVHFLKYGIYEVRKPCPTASINLFAVEHCNNSCEFCSTSSPYAKKKSYLASRFFPWLDKLENNHIPFFHIAITGGEPFLHPNLVEFIREIKGRYPTKRIGATTNFFWGVKKPIKDYIPIVDALDSLSISIYPNLVNRIGNDDLIQQQVDRLRKLCPTTQIKLLKMDQFWEWSLHKQHREVTDSCGTSDCFILRADGKMSHCSIGVADHRQSQYSDILKTSEERLFDLTKNLNGFLEWTEKYPFDLCHHCTMWKKKLVPWKQINIRDLKS